MEMTYKYTNALTKEKSPYLQQHAHNPVNWNAWNEKTLQKAKEEQKPLFISIGYATCHWCHVMEKESFEDEATAELINRWFIPIKIDREERPDLDHIYMSALHAMGIQGGWPLNIFATPQGKPFFGGTYFPPIQRYGMQSFSEVLKALAKSWENRYDEITISADEIVKTLQQKQSTQQSTGIPNCKSIEKACKQIMDSFDPEHGGFSQHESNKFPPSMALMLLLRYGKEQPDNSNILLMVIKTIEHMIRGGIYDQLGGGIHRYSTDPIWLVPHFEKMLYDQALFLSALIEICQLTENQEIHTAISESFEYLFRDMQHIEGGFYSAEDADSEGEEGIFYVWTQQQIKDLLTEKEWQLASQYWQISAKGNFEGNTILAQDHSFKNSIEEVDRKNIEQQIRAIKKKLLNIREQRPRPFRDEKILTSWNALIISSLAQAARAFNQNEYTLKAEETAHFIFNHLFDDKGRLYRRTMHNERGAKAFLVDYAQLGIACMDLFMMNWKLEWLERALNIAHEIERLFKADQGFYDTGMDQEKLLLRTQEAYDGVEPSGNSATAMLLTRLLGLGFNEFEKPLTSIFSRFNAELSQIGSNLPYMLCALSHYLANRQLVVVGDREEIFLKNINQQFLPDLSFLWVPPGKEKSFANLIPILKEKIVEKGVKAWLCEKRSCSLPVSNWEDLAVKL